MTPSWYLRNLNTFSCWLNLRYLCSQLIELSLQLFSSLVWWKLAEKEVLFDRRMLEILRPVDYVTKKIITSKKRQWFIWLLAIEQSLPRSQIKVKFPWRIQDVKYSPEVLLSGGEPIECLKKTMMKNDDRIMREFKVKLSELKLKMEVFIILLMWLGQD